MDPLVKGSITIDTSIVKVADLKRLLDFEIEALRKELLIAAMKRY